MVQPTRRIVTGHDADGRSVFLSDGPAPAVQIVEPFATVPVTMASAKLFNAEWGFDAQIGVRDDVKQRTNHRS